MTHPIMFLWAGIAIVFVVIVGYGWLKNIPEILDDSDTGDDEPFKVLAIAPAKPVEVAPTAPYPQTDEKPTPSRPRRKAQTTVRKRRKRKH